MAKLNFAKMMQEEFGFKPSRYVVETEDGTVLKVDEEVSVGSVINFGSDQIVMKVEPKEVYTSYEDDSIPAPFSHYQGFVKEVKELEFDWNGFTDIEDIYLALQGNPIPTSLLALLIKNMLSN